jgi:hypothetical protein
MVLQLYRDHSGDCMVLKHIIDSFDATHYAHATLGMSSLIKNATPSCYSTIDVYTSLGMLSRLLLLRLAT